MFLHFFQTSAVLFQVLAVLQLENKKKQLLKNNVVVSLR